LDPAWSIGPELAAVGHSETTLLRGGLFVRYEGLTDEITASGGVLRARGDQPSAYGSAQYLHRF
jgi:hypothetical protein